jgi:hypothetical protein
VTAIETRNCELKSCGAEFEPKKPWQKFHSVGCRRKAHFQNWKRTRPRRSVRDARRRAGVATHASKRMATSRGSMKRVNVGQSAHGLKVAFADLAVTRPRFMLALAASVAASEGK